MYKKILIPLDGSEQAEAVLPLVRSMASLYDATLVLLRVENPTLMLGFDEVIDQDKYHQTRLKLRQEAETYLSSIKDSLRAKDIEAKIIVANGDVVSTILDIADQQSIDLIALSIRGLNGVQQSIYESVSVGLLQRVDRPLLVTP